MGASIVANGGRIDKYLGDGLLAIFGQHCGVAEGCRQALRTAAAIDLALDGVNDQLAQQIGTKLEVGIGIDAGSLLLGRIGYGTFVDDTVIGSAVNVASRLESLTKAKSLQVMISAEVVRCADRDLNADFKDEILVRGVAEPIVVFGFTRGRDLFPEDGSAAAGAQAATIVAN